MLLYGFYVGLFVVAVLGAFCAAAGCLYVCGSDQTKADMRNEW